ncbi:MAG TPA: hypothetical protein VJR90_03025 [Gammaproteobacteria bacterium]|nr:hypothetical protein [Gammaproteobacteria bacterium]
MLRFFDYVFYRQYRYIRQAGKGEYWASWSAFSWTLVVLLVTIIGMSSLAALLTGYDVIGKLLALPSVEKYGLMAAFLLLCEGRWGLRYKIILAKFENLKETKRQALYRNIGIWMYVLVWAVVSVVIIRYQAFTIGLVQ